jgi:hypothetical protein
MSLITKVAWHIVYVNDAGTQFYVRARFRYIPQTGLEKRGIIFGNSCIITKNWEMEKVY